MEREIQFTPQNRLTLELSIHSPSDSDHYFNHHPVRAFSYSEDEDYSKNPQVLRVTSRTLDYIHDWADVVDIPTHCLKKGEYRSFNARMRVFGRPLEFGKPLPTVTIVKRFLIRRQYYRGFGERALGTIVQALTGLEELQLESWRHRPGSIFDSAFDLGMHLWPGISPRWHSNGLPGQY